MEPTDNWTEADQEFIVSTLKKYFELDRNCAWMLIDYAKDHPVETKRNGTQIISHSVRWAWLRPDRLRHYLCIDAEQGLMSQWQDDKDRGDRAFDKAMIAVKDRSLANLRIFLQNDRRGLQLWDQKFTARYGR